MAEMERLMPSELVDSAVTGVVGGVAAGAATALGIASPLARADLADRWVRSGGAWLTGRPDGPALGPPADLADLLDRLVLPGGIDPFDLLGERAAIAGLGRGGVISAGGRCRLLAADDGWLAVSIARSDDLDVLPAWLDVPPISERADPWPTIGAAVGRRPVTDLTLTAAELGLAVGGLTAGRAGGGADQSEAIRVLQRATGREPRPVAGCRVVDLSSLWAGPLCAHLLGLAGAEVIKVESVHRPDGARRGPRRFFDLLHAGHRSVAIDLRTSAGRDGLRRLLATADIVIEGSRPRALRQLGIDAGEFVAEHSIVWLSVTGHGRPGDHGLRIGFGDDAAVAGGLVAWEDGAPRFVADAVADPLTGMVGAVAVAGAVRLGGGWLLDAALSRVAAAMTGGGQLELDGPVAAPKLRTAMGSAPGLGVDNAAFGLDPVGR